VRQLSLFLTRKLKSRLLARTASASALVMAPWYHLQCVCVCRENRVSIMNLCSYEIVKTGLHIVLLSLVQSAAVWGIDYVSISKTQNCVV
jgi:hypothetical protein